MPVRLNTLQTLTRRDNVIIDIPGEDGQPVANLLDFSHIVMTPSVLREIDRIADEVNAYMSARDDRIKEVTEWNKDVDEGTVSLVTDDHPSKKPLPDIPPRSVVIEQLAYLVKWVDVVDEGGNNVPVSIELLESMELSVLEAMNTKIYMSRFPTKKHSQDSLDGTAQAAESDTKLIG